ncbi:MAG: N-succinylarginine dihydrolase [Planctomycetes bacterium]|nr:N-succinylarginine dihydrolase [Planctomycetota bacterium]
MNSGSNQQPVVDPSREAPTLIEVQIDGIIGPTHHFGGLGIGNVASLANQAKHSHPKAAALEGAAKMDQVASLGVPQFFLPPLVRPNWDFLIRCGWIDSKQRFDRSEQADALKRCADESPALLSAAYSSSYMWAANAGTFCPESDAMDGVSRLVLANLSSSLHRGMEAVERYLQFTDLFRGVETVQVCLPLPAVDPLRDEGAANHMRFAAPPSSKSPLGLHVFVHAATSVGNTFRSRQSSLASRTISKFMRLPLEQLIFAEQSPEAVDAGVFHNDVIATSNRNLFLYHEKSFLNADSLVQEICIKYESLFGTPLHLLRIDDAAIPLQEAVRTYLFNSQILSLPHGGMHMVCPVQCEQSTAARELIGNWIDDARNPILGVSYAHLSESMANGGGPACLRLRMDWPAGWLSPSAPPFHASYRWDERASQKIKEWIHRFYPDRLATDDFQRIDFADHVISAVRVFPLRG